MSDAIAAERPQTRLAAVGAGWAAAVTALAVVGGLATDTSSDWYEGLDRPSWQPPGATLGSLGRSSTS